MSPGPDVLTADDVLTLPLPKGVEGYELVDGRPVPVTAASRIHARLIVQVAYRLETHVRQAGLDGEVLTDAGFVLGPPADPERVRAPDVAYVSLSRIDPGHDPERLLRCVPDLAIEIDLTSAKKPGGQQRIVDYLEAGVPLVWAIDVHSRTAIAYRPDGSARLVRPDGTLDAGDVVPGFRLDLSELFA